MLALTTTVSYCWCDKEPNSLLKLTYRLTKPSLRIWQTEAIELRIRKRTLNPGPPKRPCEEERTVTTCGSKCNSFYSRPGYQTRLSLFRRLFQAF